MQNLSDFKPKKDFLICVDSDGCAMDTMDIKHIRCFGPCMVEEWELSEWKAPILERWNVINLYSMTRGINRFKGLAMALKEINDTYNEETGETVEGLKSRIITLEGIVQDLLSRIETLESYHVNNVSEEPNE